ncbi:hypothetical protein SNE40_006041 [Patella caerulea]|uniref:Uncharacterized protein n=1 Tax=Patella caerulea TaxID=87958 RepID=A0AAN8QAQ4_PATCE
MEEDRRERQKERRRQMAEREQKEVAETKFHEKEKVNATLVKFTNSDSGRSIPESVESSNQNLYNAYPSMAHRPIFEDKATKTGQKFPYTDLILTRIIFYDDRWVKCQQNLTIIG